MVLPIIFGLFTAFDIGLWAITGKDVIEHGTGFSVSDYILDLIGLGESPTPAPPETYDVYGMLIYAALLAIGVIAIWAYLSSSKKQKRRG